MSNFLTILRWLASRFLSKSEPPTVVVNVALPHTDVWDKTFVYRQQQRRRKQRLARRVQIEKGIV